MPYLDNHQILSSKDLHEMRDLLATMSNTDNIDVIGTGQDVNASLCLAPIGGVNLLHVTYGDVSTRIHTSEHDEDSLMLFIMTGGSASVSHRGEAFDITPTTGLMRDIRCPLTAFQDGFESFAIPLSVDMLKQHARTLIGEEVPLKDLKFDTRLDLNLPGGRHLSKTVHYIAESANGQMVDLENSIVTAALRDLLLTSVLMSLPNSYSDLLRHRSKTNGPVPYYVKRARDFIHENVMSAISLDQLARHAGCGYRTLQMGFNEAFGMSPMAYVKFVRLNCVRGELRHADGNLTVRAAALKWGFSHMGAFTQAYQQQFGVLPSQTRRMRD